MADFMFSANRRFMRQRRRKRRSSERGQGLLTAAVICGALGIDTDLTLIYQLFAVIVCLLIGSRIALATNKPDVAIKRRLPRYATCGEPFEYYIDITNQGEQVERDLTLVDQPRQIAPTRDEYNASMEPGEESRNAWDRWIGFHRFMWLQRIKTGITTRQREVPEIGVHGRTSVAIEASPLRRGIVHFRSTLIMHPDPLGLNYGITTFDNAEPLLILPQRYPIPATYEVPGGRHFQPGGVNSAWALGESDEFVSLRDYRDGDSMKRIHWPSTAKRDKPVVREYQDEYFVRQALLLDTSTAELTILDEAVSVAASFALRMSRSESMIDLMFLTDRPELVVTGEDGSGVIEQLEALACIEPSPQPVEILVDAFVRRLQQFSGGVVVLSGWDKARADAVTRLTRTGLPLTILAVTREAVPDSVHALHPEDVPGGLARL